MSNDGPIQLSPLAQKALAQIQQRAGQEINEVLQMDAEAQDIDTGAYQFHQQAGVWVSAESDGDDDPDLELMD